jgi:formate dehydrogenase subunit gamma
MGANRLAAEAERLLGVRLGETAADGSVTLDAVYCLGLCAVAPSALIDDKPVGRLDATKLAEALRDA